MGETKDKGAAQTPDVSRNYKSTVLTMLFGYRERLLRLYNAVISRVKNYPEDIRRTLEKTGEYYE